MENPDTPVSAHDFTLPGLKELLRAVDVLPPEYRGQVEAAVQKVEASINRRRRILALVHEALSQVRLDMKCLTFDLEATRRERDEARRQLDQ